MRYRQRLNDLLAQLEAFKLEFQTLKQKLKNEGIPFIKSGEHGTLLNSIYRCKKKIQAEETYLSENNIEQTSSPIVFNKVHFGKVTAGFVNVHDQKLRLLEDARFCRWRYLIDKGFVTSRESEDYNLILNSIRRLKLRSSEDELIFLRRYLKDNGLPSKDLQGYKTITNHIRRLKQQIDPLFYHQIDHQKSLKKLVIKQKKSEFQFEMLKQTLKNGGILTRDSREYNNLRRSISRRKERIAFENSITIYEIIFL